MHFATYDTFRSQNFIPQPLLQFTMSLFTLDFCTRKKFNFHLMGCFMSGESSLFACSPYQQ